MSDGIDQIAADLAGNVPQAKRIAQALRDQYAKGRAEAQAEVLAIRRTTMFGDHWEAEREKLEDAGDE